MTVAGAVTAIGGITLLVIGAIGLVRRARRRWRLPLTAAVLALFYVAESTIDVAVAATNVPPPPWARPRRR